MRVSFDGGRLNERGVAVALFDYAFYARELLGVEPIILHDVASPPDPAHVRRFAEAFPTFGYAGDDDWQRLVERERVDAAYALKIGRRLAKVSKSSRTAVHEVFRFFKPHGDAYAYVSSWLAREMTGGRYPCVPHMVDLPAARRDARAALGLPKDAFVVGRHGGADTFDVPFAPRAIEAALARRRNLWLVLLNTPRFSDHERILHLPPAADRQRIADFIAACDAGLNARRVGESFGLAIAEFLACDKPVLVWAGGRDRNHLALVDDPAFVYRTAKDLTRLLTELTPARGDGAFAAKVAEFTPPRVMQAFARVFLTGGQTFPAAPLGLRQKRKAVERLRRWRDAWWSR
jgi:glycosyltransferase involved in cell wall biosynthesis